MSGIFSKIQEFIRDLRDNGITVGSSQVED